MNRLPLIKSILMGIIKTHDDFEHPEGKIQLLNGSVLDCFPLEQAEEQGG